MSYFREQERVYREQKKNHHMTFQLNFCGHMTRLLTARIVPVVLYRVLFMRLIFLLLLHLKGGPFFHLGVSETSLPDWEAAEVGIMLAYTFSGRTQLN